MPVDILVNGKKERIFPTKKYQKFDIKRHSQVEVMDWRFYILPKENEV
jgi:aminopeptidase N